MFQSQSTSSQFLGIAARSTRKPGTLTVLLMAAALVLSFASASRVFAQGRLNIQQLGDALTSYGKNTVTQNGQTYYTVTCGHGQWKSSVVVSLSPNGSVVWMTIDPTRMPSRISSSALAGILKKNQELGPMFFSINGNSLRLSYPVPNNALNEKMVKAYLEELVNTAVDTEPLWDAKALGSN